MIWHAFNISRGLSMEYWELPREVIGVHHLMLLACASAGEGRGNNGVWQDAASWDTRRWLRASGLEKSEVDALVAHGLARWTTRQTSNALIYLLTPNDGQDQEDGWDWERCRVTAEALAKAEQRTLSIRSTHLVDPRSTHLVDPIDADLSEIDMVCLDYDLGGQIRAQLVSEMKRKAAKVRWDMAKQLELPTKPEPSDAACRSGSNRDRHTAQDARAMHNHSHSTKRSPPNPPPGGPPLVVEPNATDAAQLESFWAWLLEHRPADMNSAHWGGGKAAAFRAIWTKASANWIPLPELVATIKGDLARKFKDRKWVRDWTDSGKGFRAYVRDDDWQTPLPVERRPELVVIEGDKKETVATRNLLEMLSDADVPDARKSQAKTKWLAEHPGQRPPWEPEASADVPGAPS